MGRALHAHPRTICQSNSSLVRALPFVDTRKLKCNLGNRLETQPTSVSIHQVWQAYGSRWTYRHCQRRHRRSGCGQLSQGIGKRNLARYRGDMPRYALKIEYHGAPFAGWQRQQGQLSVQRCIEDALRMLEPDCGTVTAAGRTDAGVHATGQVAHCDLVRDWTPFRLSEALNQHLKPQPVAIVDVAAVADDFHARFWARRRRYLYRLVCRRAPVTHDQGLVWQLRRPLDTAAMQAGAAHLLGRHDFTTFRSTSCQADSPVKTLDRLDIEEMRYPGGTEYRFHVSARSFLHNQVRSFVGTLQQVGARNWSPGQVRDALVAADRAACGPVCPPHGLYLAQVDYDSDPFARASG